jgi:hypothetical protein
VKRATLVIAFLILGAVAARGDGVSIEPLTINPTNLKVGDSMVVDFTIHGSRDRDLRPWYRVSVDGKVLSANRIEIPSTRGYAETSAPWAPTAGPHEFVVEVDPENELGLRVRRAIRMPAPGPARFHKSSRPMTFRFETLRLLGDPPMSNDIVEFEVAVKTLNVPLALVPLRVHIDGPDGTRVQSLVLSTGGHPSGLRFNFEPDVPGSYKVRVDLDPENLLGLPAAARQSRALSFQVQPMPHF